MEHVQTHIPCVCCSRDTNTLKQSSTSLFKVAFGYPFWLYHCKVICKLKSVEVTPEKLPWESAREEL